MGLSSLPARAVRDYRIKGSRLSRLDVRSARGEKPVDLAEAVGQMRQDINEKNDRQVVKLSVFYACIEADQNRHRQVEAPWGGGQRMQRTQERRREGAQKQ